MQIEIYGCKVNKYYLDTWMKYFEHHGIDSNDVIIASCVVTDRAKKKWVKSILKKVKISFSHSSRQQGKIKKIYLTGCGSLDQGKKMDEEKFYHLYPELAPYRDQIVLLGESPDSYDYSLAHKKKMSTKVEEKKQRLYTRKFVVIQNGCDSFCSFCLTVQARGRHRSRSLEDIIVEIKEREDQGGQEIILTGVNLGAWGAETTTDPRMASLGRLLRAILDKTSIPRIRISSLGPEFVNEELLEVCKNIRILPYFHFSIQSFSNTVLEGMRRNYTAQYVKDIIAKFRHLDRSDNNLINIGTDIIAGFPGEGDAEFAETLQGLRECNISQLHAFPFSPHQKAQTVAASHLHQAIPYHIAKMRVKLLQLQGKHNRDVLIQKTFGHKVSVLIEKVNNGIGYGRTENYLPVAVHNVVQTNAIVNVTYSHECQADDHKSQ